MADKIYPKGLRGFKPHATAPEFVLGTLIITPSELTGWMNENASLATDYKGTPQFRCQILKGDNGPYIVLDQYKAKEQHSEPSTGDDSGLPF